MDELDKLVKNEIKKRIAIVMTTLYNSVCDLNQICDDMEKITGVDPQKKILDDIAWTVYDCLMRKSEHEKGRGQ